MFIIRVHLRLNTTHSDDLVTSTSTTVPGGGFAKFLPASRKNFAFILLLTITHANFGLKSEKLAGVTIGR